MKTLAFIFVAIVVAASAAAIEGRYPRSGVPAGGGVAAQPATETSPAVWDSMVFDSGVWG